MALLRDAFVFLVVQVVLLAVYSVALWNDRRARRESRWNAVPIRGEKSRGYFHWTFAVSSATLLAILEFGEALQGYKIVTALVDVAALARLCYFSPWSRNRIVRIGSRWSEGREA